MAATRRCGRCGNVIPDWSGGVCPICGRVSQAEKRLWPGGKKDVRRRYRLPRDEGGDRPSFTPVERPKPKPAVPIHQQPARVMKKSIGRRTRGRRRLNGFNRLLRDVYRRSVWLGHLLTQQGVSRDQVSRWREDGIWLVRFLRRLEQKLQSLLAEAVPHCDCRVLSLWYGLDGQGARSPTEISAELGMATKDVLAVRLEQLRHLWRENGQAAFENTVLSAAEETERICEQTH
jgi:hypothetical protein